MATNKTVKSVKVEKPAKAVKPVAKKATGKLAVDVYDLKGKVVESMSLPEAVFGASLNKTLIAQAVRVYLANQREGAASTKTRGQVAGSTRKIYQQKGTGRARHGGIRAPIFVHGGIAHGPHPRDYSLSFPQKMRKAALRAALSTKFQDGVIKVVKGLEKIEPKTKAMAAFLNAVGVNATNGPVLIVMGNNHMPIMRSARNLGEVSYVIAQTMHTYEVMRHRTIIVMADAIAALEKPLVKKD